MSQVVSSSNEFTWTGSLGLTDIRSIYERCQRLRLTGTLELQRGAERQEVVWLGGQPVTEDLGDLLGWVIGEFRVTQRIPTPQGALSGGIELRGALRPGQVQALYELCGDHRLSADVFLQRTTGETAQVRFTHGKVESATVNGEKGLALQALGTLSQWGQGTYCIRLRALFGDEAPLEAPIIIEKHTQKRDFDVTGAMQIPTLQDIDRHASRNSRPAPSQSSSPGPPKVEVLPQSAASQPGTAPSESSIRSLAAMQAADAHAPPMPPPLPRQDAPPPPRSPQPLPPAGRKASAQKVWTLALVIGIVGGAAAFVAMGALRGLWQGGSAATQIGRPAAVPPPSPPPSPAVPGRPVAPIQQEPPRDPETREPAGQREGPPASDSREAQTLADRAQRLIVEGRNKAALEVLARARELAPEDAALSALERQARGDLGRGELVLTGKGEVTINGKPFEAPRKLHLMAGPYRVNGKVVELKDGEHRDVSAGPAGKHGSGQATREKQPAERPAEKTADGPGEQPPAEPEKAEPAP